MWILLVPLLVQEPLESRILVTEHQRAEDVSALALGIQGTDARLQRLAVRAVGRLERPGLASMIEPMLHASNASVRVEAVNALGQLKTPFDFEALLRSEPEAQVRAIIYATIGRIPVIAGVSERTLAQGLRDSVMSVRTGAARGLESLFRLNPRGPRPDTATFNAIHQAVRDNTDASLRKYLIQAMTVLTDQDSVTFATVLHDTDAQVRRLAVLGWRPRGDDPPFSGKPEAMADALTDTSALVRYEALKILATCELAKNAISDPSDHVVLLGVDLLGTRRCDVAFTLDLLENASAWRVRAHALVSLARLAPEAVRARITRYATDPNWVMRVYAVNAAKIIRDDPTLARLAMDSDPNVALAAMSTSADAIRALSSDHNGLLFTAAQRLRGKPELASAMPQILATVLRLSKTGRATYRDAKMQLLERIKEAGAPTIANSLRPLLTDVDPSVAVSAAAIITQKSGTKVAPVTTQYAFAPLPPDVYLSGLIGATAVFTMKGLGSFTMALLMDEAPASAASFAQVAEKGVFNGLTFHRVVSNFLVQGGSPGADEYDGATSYFMPEEVGLLWHDRGTVGTSTRGHDTGDGQLYINTVDNYRLDNSYTLYGRLTSGMDVVDRIMEGDVIESVRIVRKLPGTP